jgi:hypothetical protein
MKGLKKLPFKTDEQVILTYNQNKSIQDTKVVSFWRYFYD